MFHPTFGMVNAFLLRFQLIDDYIPWLTQRFLLLNLASVVVSWRTIPLVSVVLLAALNNIPDTLYESAYIDGAGKLGIFSYIKLPLMAPSLVIGFTLATVNSINLFDEIITLSGFAGSTRTVLLEAYVRTFSFLNFGEGSAFIYLVMMLNASICFYCIQRGKRREVQYL
jgi:multiple sugar transport system permease protein